MQAGPMIMQLGWPSIHPSIHLKLGVLLKENILCCSMTSTLLIVRKAWQEKGVLGPQGSPKQKNLMGWVVHFGHQSSALHTILWQYLPLRKIYLNCSLYKVSNLGLINNNNKNNKKKKEQEQTSSIDWVHGQNRQTKLLMCKVCIRHGWVLSIRQLVFLSFQKTGLWFPNSYKRKRVEMICVGLWYPTQEGRKEEPDHFFFIKTQTPAKLNSTLVLHSLTNTCCLHHAIVLFCFAQDSNSSWVEFSRVELSRDAWISHLDLLSCLLPSITPSIKCQVS
jgi:hypothetical protein